MAWYTDWELRCQRLLRDGLRVLVEGVRVDPVTGFIGIYLIANESDLPRSNVDRDFDLHVTLGYVEDYYPGVATAAVERINERWRGRLVRLNVAWMGCGASAQLAEEDDMARDVDIRWLHSRGYYGNGRLTRVRGLHVSL